MVAAGGAFEDEPASVQQLQASGWDRGRPSAGTGVYGARTIASGLREIMAYENWFHQCHNRLLIELRLGRLAAVLQDRQESVPRNLLCRIAISVYQNSPVCEWQ